MNEIEIIIPAFNAHKTISKTLDSICIQEETPAFHVTIVNDYGEDYQQIVDYYKDKINISELKTPENIGPGGARQYGIDNTKSKYIIFIDSDDYFYDKDAVNKLYNKINNTDSDLVISSIIYERDGVTEIKEHSMVWLHGKIYRRDFLEKNKIRFNSTRSNEDNGFNSLLILLHPAVVVMKDITYVYHENPESITRANNRAFKLWGYEGYAYNINWAIEEAEKRGATPKDLAWKTLEGLLVMYKNYNFLYEDDNVDKIVEWSKDLFRKYKVYYSTIRYFETEMVNDYKAENEHVTFAEFKEMIKV